MPLSRSTQVVKKQEWLGEYTLNTSVSPSMNTGLFPLYQLWNLLYFNCPMTQEDAVQWKGQNVIFLGSLRSIYQGDNRVKAKQSKQTVPSKCCLLSKVWEEIQCS